MKYYIKFIEYAYLVIGVLFAIEAFRKLGVDNSRSFLMIALGVMALLMFFFKRWFRKKIRRENPDK